MRNRAILIITCAVFLVGCRDERSWTVADGWYHPRPPAVSHALTHAVPWAEVKATAIAEAESRLASSDCEPVTRDDASKWVAHLPSGSETDTLFLVRGVYLSRETGGFAVEYDGTNLFIHHASVGRQPLPMKRQPLVVALPAKPEHVWTSVSMAE